MRVALDATPLLGQPTGVGQFCTGLLRELVRAGTVDVQAVGATWSARRALGAVVPEGVPAATWPLPAALLHAAWQRADAPPIEWLTGRVDVVHGTNFVVAPARHAARVVTVHDLTAVRFPELCEGAALRYPTLVRRAVAAGAWVHTPSVAVAEEVVEHFGAEPGRVRAVHSGVPVLAEPDAAAPGRYLAPSAHRYVLAVGRAEPRKDLPALVGAFDLIAGERPDLALVLAGPSGWGSRALEEALEKARWHDRVVVTGWLDDRELAGLIAGAAVLAYPSLYEGFGFPPLQAMAQGTPVVATRVGALAEVLGDAACLVEPGDGDELAGALAAVLDSEHLARDLAARGVRRAAAFTWERCAAGVVSLYRDAVDARDTRDPRHPSAATEGRSRRIPLPTLPPLWSPARSPAVDAGAGLHVDVDADTRADADRLLERHGPTVALAVEQLRRPVPGGIGRYAEELARAIGRSPHPRVELLASRHRGTGEDPLARLGLPLRTSPLAAPYLTLAWDVGLARAPSEAAVVHSVSLAAPPVGAGRGARSCALVVTIHDLAWRELPASTTARGRRWHEAALRRVLARADAFVVPSRSVLDSICAMGARRVEVIGHGVDHLPPPDHEGATALLEALGVGGDFLLSVGTLEPRKNLRRLVSAYGAAVGDGSLPDTPALVVVGPTGWGDGGPPVAPGVVAAGRVDDAVLASLYSRALAFVYVPLAEGFGLPPLEAMACGAPVLASASVPSTAAGARELPPALLVDPVATGAIADGIVRIATDGELRAELVERGRARVEPMTWARSAAAHLALWESLA